MEFLVLNPPVCTPSEPPSGAFVLASALSGHGFHTGFLDLSLELYFEHLRPTQNKGSLFKALDYLNNRKSGYSPNQHRSACGAVHHQLKQFSKAHPGWKLTAMDIVAPSPVHKPLEIQETLKKHDPFLSLWQTKLLVEIEKHKPKHIIISLSYLSQLTAGISLVQFIEKLGIPFTVGGSLLRSLSVTGEGFTTLKKCLRNIDISDGTSFTKTDTPILHKLHYPEVLNTSPYICARPILPLTLSIGCYWSKCLFCPDKGMKYTQTKMDAIESFLSSVPKELMAKNPVIHLLDSAMPKNQLEKFLPIAKQFNVQFYGFARPEKKITENYFIEKLADHGCLMLQLGVESGNHHLLSTFDKGLDPKDSKETLFQAAEAGIRTYVYLLFGLPGETADMRDETLQFIKSSINTVDFLNLSIFNLPKYCELTDRAAEFDICLDNYTEDPNAIELYRPFTMNGHMLRADARRFISDEFSQDEKIRKAVLQTPKWFRAAHLALMDLPGRN